MGEEVDIVEGKIFGVGTFLLTIPLMIPSHELARLPIKTIRRISPTNKRSQPIIARVIQVFLFFWGSIFELLARLRSE